MGVFLGGQVQQRVGRVQVPVAAPPVGQPGDLDLPEDGAQAPLVPALHCRVSAPGRVDDLDPDLLPGAQVEVVLE